MRIGKIASIAAGVLILAGVALFMWQFVAKGQPGQLVSQEKKDEVPIAPPLRPARTPPPGFKEYRNEFYKFQVFYPDSLTVTEYKEKGSAITLTFQNADRSQGFQAFIAPFGGTTITETRIKTDEPSGVVIDLAEATIDGQKGITFFGHNDEMGDTREVWFIARGFLYEITTYKALDSWLRNIMGSWQFL